MLKEIWSNPHYFFWRGSSQIKNSII